MMIIMHMPAILKVIELPLLTTENMSLSACGVVIGTFRLQKILMVSTPLSGNLLIDTVGLILSG